MIIAIGTYNNKLIPLLKSVRESTASPKIKGVYTLAILAMTMLNNAKITLIFRSLLLFGHKKGNKSLDVLNNTEFLYIS